MEEGVQTSECTADGLIRLVHLSEFGLPGVEDVGRLLLAPLEVVHAIRLRPVLVHLLLAHQLQDRLQRLRPVRRQTQPLKPTNSVDTKLRNPINTFRSGSKSINQQFKLNE